jgi:hypothetical protein
MNAYLNLLFEDLVCFRNIQPIWQKNRANVMDEKCKTDQYLRDD